MSEIHQCSDDITTDALPNPRNTQESLDKERAENENDINNDHNIPQQTNHKKSNLYSFTTKKKSNAKKFIPSASATIINISKSRDIHVGNTITYNVTGNEKNKKTDNFSETPAVKVLMDSKKIVSKEDLRFVSTHITSEWKDMARDLGLGDGQISQFIADNHIYGTEEIIYQILLDWYQNEPTDATIGKLTTILWNNGQKYAVQRWSQERE